MNLYFIILLILLSNVCYCFSMKYKQKWNQCKCGLRPSQERIVGGSIFKPNSYPWLVALVKHSNNSELVCGGTLISSRHVLTAGHCFQNWDNHILNPSSIDVLLGAHDLTANNHFTFKIHKLNMFPLFRYSNQTYAPIYDLTLLQLNDHVKLSNQIRPICLYSRSFANFIKTIMKKLNKFDKNYNQRFANIALLKFKRNVIANDLDWKSINISSKNVNGWKLANHLADEWMFNHVPFANDWPTMNVSNHIWRYVRKPLIVSGWGSTVADGSPLFVSSKARHVQIKETSIRHCMAMYGSDVINIYRSLCSGLTGQDACAGDSGGPVIAFQNGRANLQAVVSFGDQCGSSFSPGVNTLIDTYLGWLLWQIRHDKLCFD